LIDYYLRLSAILRMRRLHG